ncbi:MAG: hypothetical protein ACJ8ER_09930 [Allosphingosinicella sp.]
MSIFKYFMLEAHARAFMNKGELLLRPLSYFRAHEDGQVRGDPRDALLTYAPISGLEVTKEDGTSLTLEGWRFTSSAKHDNIFVYCASSHLSIELAARFESSFCVEICSEHLVSRLKRRASRTSTLDYEGLVSGPVEYRNPEKKPGADWALPETVAFIKPEGYAWQEEFRIAIGKRGAFEAENVDCALESGQAARAASSDAPPPLILRIGKLADFTQLHRF